jgi:glycosyltransferase involved in cell wall biosynthesis
MIVVMEPYWRGLSHTPGNASFLRVVRAAFPDEPILFLAEKRHISGVLADASDISNLRAIEIELPDEETSPYARLLRDWRNISRAFGLMPDGGRNLLALCSAHRSVLAASVLARRLVGNRDDVVIARLHGNLNEITHPRSRNPFRQALRLETGLKYAGKAGVRLVVLEQSIRAELVTMRPGLVGQVYVLEEPATTEPESTFDAPTSETPVRFAFLGVGTRDKGADRFLAAAEEVGRKIGTRGEFELIGRLHPSLAHLSTAVLSRPPGADAMPRSAYVELLKRQHYVCAFYDPQYYRLAASGVLLDAIAHRKPLIVTDIPFAKELFERFGDLGYICRSQAEVVETMARLATVVDAERYQRQIENLTQVARSRNITALAPRFRALAEGRQ